MSEVVSEDKVEIERLVITSDEEVKRFLKEGEQLLDNGEIVQACEKIYKAAEDAVKLLAKAHVPDVQREVKSRGRRTVSLLDKAGRNLEIKFGEDVGRGWAEAWILHVEGFHEERLKEEAVKWRLKHVKRLVELVNNLSPEKKFWGGNR